VNRVSRNFQSAMILCPLLDHVKESRGGGSWELPIARWWDRKPRERQANSRMRRVLAAQDTVFQNLQEEDTMKPSTKDRAEGKFHEVKGKIKEKAGKATNNPNLENEGINEKTAGKVQKKIGQVEKVLGD
jgi:uncharacterized protein YjbJ (UPF0337 family)